MLMMSVLAMSVAVAGADITRPTCGSRIRADDMCYAAGLPGSKAETVRKPGVCFACLVPSAGAGVPVQPVSRVHPALGTVVVTDARWTLPWRPPRA